MPGSKKRPPRSENSAVGVDLAQLERLLTFMSEHGLEEFEYVRGNVRIRLKKAGAHPAAAPVLALATAPIATAAPVQAPASPPPAPPVASEREPETTEPTPQAAEGEHVIKSPIVGTFYAGPSPDAAPFVRLGDTVEAGQTVCIIEAMKLMNEIEADIRGEVVRILVENGHPVEYGEPLFALRPADKKK